MKIIIDGEPIAQIRMKFSGRNGIGRVYDPRHKEKKRLKELIASKSSSLLQYPRISFIFHMPIPKSISKKLLPIYTSGLLKHIKKPDVDNLIKLYLDCMDGIVFDGDQKASLGPSIKLYHPYPKTIIMLNETEELLSPLEVDPLTWFALFGKESGRCSSSEMDCLADWYTPDQLSHRLPSDMIYPQQKIPSSGILPLAHELLERARQACKQSHGQP